MMSDSVEIWCVGTLWGRRGCRIIEFVGWCIMGLATAGMTLGGL